MAEVLFTEGFLEDMAQVERADKRREIMRVLALLPHTPEIGSRALPPSIRASYGDTVRKLVIAPFDVIYEYHGDKDEVHVLALIHQRQAR